VHFSYQDSIHFCNQGIGSQFENQTKKSRKSNAVNERQVNPVLMVRMIMKRNREAIEGSKETRKKQV
jgi:hypothetical protein